MYIIHNKYDGQYIKLAVYLMLHAFSTGKGVETAVAAYLTLHAFGTENASCIWC